MLAAGWCKHACRGLTLAAGWGKRARHGLERLGAQAVLSHISPTPRRMSNLLGWARHPAACSGGQRRRRDERVRVHAAHAEGAGGSPAARAPAQRPPARRRLPWQRRRAPAARAPVAERGLHVRVHDPKVAHGRGCMRGSFSGQEQAGEPGSALGVPEA